MQVICTLALHHPLTAVSHEVTLRYAEQMQHSSLSCFAVGHTSTGSDIECIYKIGKTYFVLTQQVNNQDKQKRFVIYLHIYKL